jgi:predicted small metal-binding protein
MPEFQCDSPVCGAKIRAHTKDELMVQVADHVRTAHQIPVPTKTILQYLEATSVTDK